MTDDKPELLDGKRVRVLPLDDTWAQEARDVFPGCTGVVQAIRPDPFSVRRWNALVEFDTPVQPTDVFNRFRGATHFHFSAVELEILP